ncbi:MAG: RNA polymerase sigma factor [Gammaproteobacteria bacterium]
MNDSNVDTDSGGEADRQLVQAYLRARGDSEFRALYRRHTPALYRMALGLVGPTLADDIVQETWCRAAQHIAKFAWRSKLLTWLTSILINCCRETWRASGAIVTLPIESDFDEPEVDVPPWRAIDLERALETLPPGYREVLVLHDVEGFTHAEIARALGTVPGTSKSQLARARRVLRQRLEGSMAPIRNGGTGS